MAGDYPSEMPLSLVMPEHRPSRPLETKQRITEQSVLGFYAKSPSALSDPETREVINSIIDLFHEEKQTVHTLKTAITDYVQSRKNQSDQAPSIMWLNSGQVCDLLPRGEIFDLAVASTSRLENERGTASISTRTSPPDSALLSRTPTIGVHAGRDGRLSVFSNVSLEEPRYANAIDRLTSAAQDTAAMTQQPAQIRLQAFAANENADPSSNCRFCVLSDEECRALENIRHYGIRTTGPMPVDWSVFDPLLRLDVS
jgi:hypothetical protein